MGSRGSFTSTQETPLLSRWPRRVFGNNGIKRASFVNHITNSSKIVAEFNTHKQYIE